jgi:hypothetical protein
MSATLRDFFNIDSFHIDSFFMVLTFAAPGKILRAIGCERNDKDESVPGAWAGRGKAISPQRHRGTEKNE